MNQINKTCTKIQTEIWVQLFPSDDFEYYDIAMNCCFKQLGISEKFEEMFRIALAIFKTQTPSKMKKFSQYTNFEREDGKLNIWIFQGGDA